MRNCELETLTFREGKSKNLFLLQSQDYALKLATTSLHFTIYLREGQIYNHFEYGQLRPRWLLSNSPASHLGAHPKKIIKPNGPDHIESEITNKNAVVTPAV
jgi:hypothetical protein